MWCSNAVVQAKQWVESALLVERVSGEMRPALDTTFLVDALYSSKYVYVTAEELLRRRVVDSDSTQHHHTFPAHNI